MDFLVKNIGNFPESGNEMFPKMLRNLRIREQTPGCRIYPTQNMVDSQFFFDMINLFPVFKKNLPKTTKYVNWDIYDFCEKTRKLERASYLIASAITKNNLKDFAENRKKFFREIAQEVIFYIDNEAYNPSVFETFMDSTDFYPPLIQDFLFVYVKALKIKLTIKDYVFLLALSIIAKSRVEFYTFNTSFVALTLIYIFTQIKNLGKLEEIYYIMDNFCEETNDNLRRCRGYICRSVSRPEFRDFWSVFDQGVCSTFRKLDSYAIDQKDAPNQSIRIIDCGLARTVKVLGKGAYGSVSIGEIDRETIAVKKFLGAGGGYSLIDEYVNAKDLNYPFLAKPLGYNLRSGCVTYKLMGQDLDSFIDFFANKNETMPEAMKRIIMYQLLQGIDYLHANQTIHLDIKPANILMDLKPSDIARYINSKGFTGKLFHLEIADMGISIHTNFNLLSGMIQRFWAANTISYRPPEYFADYFTDSNPTPTLTTSIDVWAVGVVMIEMYLGVNPFWHSLKVRENQSVDSAVFERIKQVMKNVKTATWRYYVPDIPEDAMDLLNRLLDENPDRRITASAALNHSYNDWTERKYSVLNHPV